MTKIYWSGYDLNIFDFIIIILKKIVFGCLAFFAAPGHIDTLFPVRALYPEP